jgi:DNA replication initiation complex subunit (GINS family)
VGRLESNIFLTGENPLGTFRAMIMQTAEQAEDAVKAYEETLKKPPIPIGVKSLPPPVPTPPPKPPFISKEEFMEMVRENLEHLIKQVYPQLTVEEVFTIERQREAEELYQKLKRIKPFREDLEKTVRNAVKRWCLEALPAPIEYVKIRFLKDIPAIVGADMKTYGPFKEGEIAELPKPNAEALVKQEVVTYELVPPPPKPPPPPAKVRVRFKYPYSAFFVRGVKYGAFMKGDVAEIPIERARRLVERGYAQLIEESAKAHSSSSDDGEKQPLTLEYKILEYGGFG